MPTLEPFHGQQIPEQFRRWIEVLRQKFNPIPDFVHGTGSPEGVVFASKGARYFNDTGGAGTLLYVKNTTADLNTGWIAYG